ncbi:MAG: formyltransferase [Gammaproteobacteria bacterium]|nr:formyltransferase [Gammaproteobacteria bacterium]
MTSRPVTAVVFAYHQIGVRCLSVLLAGGVDVRLVVTHRDSATETIWWQSVAGLAGHAGIPVIMPDDPNDPEVVSRVDDCAPDFIFSFYYRHLLTLDMLNVPNRGAFNLHGSLLPRYRGRVPVNWVLINGESETGVSLHRMVIKPDAGALVDQESVTILPNDTAHELFLKLVCAAERLLQRLLPDLLAGSWREYPLDLSAGSYFGGRRPEDGRVDWSQTAWKIHNLIRAVAPPYPGAFSDLAGRRLQIYGSYWRGESGTGDNNRIYWQSGRCFVDCSDGKRIELSHIAVDGEPLDELAFLNIFGSELKVGP